MPSCFFTHTHTCPHQHKMPRDFWGTLLESQLHFSDHSSSAPRCLPRLPSTQYVSKYTFSWLLWKAGNICHGKYSGKHRKCKHCGRKSKRPGSFTHMWLCAVIRLPGTCDDDTYICTPVLVYFLPSSVSTVACQEVGKVLQFSFLNKNLSGLWLLLSSFQLYQEHWTWPPGPTALWLQAFDGTALAPWAFTVHIHTRLEEFVNNTSLSCAYTSRVLCFVTCRSQRTAVSLDAELVQETEFYRASGRPGPSATRSQQAGPEPCSKQLAVLLRASAPGAWEDWVGTVSSRESCRDSIHM